MGKSKNNSYAIEGDVAILTMKSKRKGYELVETKFNADVFPLVSTFTWRLVGGNIKQKMADGSVKVRTEKQLYVQGKGYLDGVSTEILLQRLMLNNPKGFLVDHRDGNTFNNMRSNLRPATPSQNAANSRPRKGRLYKGVSVCKRGSGVKYIAQIQANGKQIYLGTFGTAKEAAKAYNVAAEKYYDEFAYKNVFPEDAHDSQGNPGPDHPAGQRCDLLQPAGEQPERISPQQASETPSQQAA